MLRWRLYRDNYRFMNLESLKRRSYFLLLLTSFLFLVLFLTTNVNERFVVNIHDTYYVVEFQHCFILLCLSFLTTGLFYLIFDYFKIQLFYFLSRIHIYGSLVIIGLFFFYLHKINSAEDFQLFDSIDYNFRIIISLLIFVFLQLIFAINLITSIIKKLSNLTSK
jgi:hypothetical protein